MSATRTAKAFLIALACATALVGCGSIGPAVDPLTATVGSPVWPKPPEEPRVRYLHSVSGPADWGITKSLLRRFIDALTSNADEHLVRPTGVAVYGRVMYVADPGARAVWILDAEENRSIKVTDLDDIPLAAPVAVAPAPAGGVFFADSVRKEVVLLSREGKPTGFAVREGLLQPVALAYDRSSGRLYVADAAANQVFVYDENGSRIGFAGKPGGGDGELNRPTHLALDRAGLLLVTDALNFRVQAFDLDQKFAWKIGIHGDSSGELAAPKGVACDSEGRLILVDALFDSIQFFDRDGTYLLTLGGRGEGPGQFWLPNGLFIDTQDRIFVADAYNRRIQVLDAIPDAKEEPSK